jgi:hypothetical protein
VKRATVVNRRKDGGMDYAVNVGFLRNNLNLLVAVRRWAPAASSPWRTSTRPSSA